MKLYFIIYTNFYTLGCTWFNLLSALQIQWLKQSGFGGAMVWSLDLDDFTGTFCGQGRYPLINTLKSGLGTGTCNACINYTYSGNLLNRTVSIFLTSFIFLLSLQFSF